MCRHQDPQSQAYALGYVLGVYDHETTMRQKVTLAGEVVTTKQFICTPPGVAAGQILDISCRYVASHPETRHEAANVLVYSSLLEVWRCR